MVVHVYRYCGAIQGYVKRISQSRIGAIRFAIAPYGLRSMAGRLGDFRTGDLVQYASLAIAPYAKSRFLAAQGV